MQTMMVMNDMNRRTEQSLIPVGNVSSRPPPPRPIRSIYSAAFVKMTGNRSQVMPAEFSDNHDDDDDAAENKLHANSSSTHPSRSGGTSKQAPIKQLHCFACPCRAPATLPIASGRGTTPDKQDSTSLC